MYRYLFNFMSVVVSFITRIIVAIMYKGYNNDDMAFFNNHSSRTENQGFYLNSMDGEHTEVAYNRACGNDDDGFFVTSWYLWANGFHHNSVIYE